MATYTLIMIGATQHETKTGDLDFMTKTVSDLTEASNAQDWHYILYDDGRLIKTKHMEKILMPIEHISFHLHLARVRIAA